MVTIKGIDPKMIANNLEPSEQTHPGELLKEEIEYRGISQKKLAKETGISYKVLNEILNCRRPITTNIALLVEAALGIPAHILTGLQMDYNMQTAKTCKHKEDCGGALIKKSILSFDEPRDTGADYIIKFLQPKRRSRPPICFQRAWKRLQ